MRNTTKEYFGKNDPNDLDNADTILADPEFNNVLREDCFDWIERSFEDFDQLYYNDVEFSAK